MLAARAVLALLEHIRSGPKITSDLPAAMQAISSESQTRTANTVQLLTEIGVLEDLGDQVRLADSTQAASALHEHVALAILRGYLALITGTALGSVFQLRGGPTDLWADQLQLPHRDLGYPYLLLEFGLAARPTVDARFWQISPEATPLVMDALDAISRRIPSGRLFSLADLKRAQENREAAGRRAEEFVVQFERDRLARHPFRNRVRSISDEDASAGYDVVSYDTDRVLTFDRFIEVKGHGDTPSFFWSEGEIECARAMGNAYWLYLVDLARTSEQGYEPAMIQDPAAYFVDRTPEDWVVEPQSMKFTKLSNRTAA